MALLGAKYVRSEAGNNLTIIHLSFYIQNKFQAVNHEKVCQY